ncbi:hypothetical protein V2A60_000795 [Cordyceps javanica]
MDFDSRFQQNIRGCEQILLHTFLNKLRCAESLNGAGSTASVYVVDGRRKILPKNDRLAVYGDSVASAMLCQDWYHGGSDRDSWTSIRTTVLCNDYLAARGFALGLDSCLNKNDGTYVVSKKMMATAVEAILGAVHLDGGDDALRRVLRHLRIVNPDELSVVFAKAAKFHFEGLSEFGDAFDFLGHDVFALQGKDPLRFEAAKHFHSQRDPVLHREAPWLTSCKCIAKPGRYSKMEIGGLYKF